jgi:hypothetical protein
MQTHRAPQADHHLGLQFRPVGLSHVRQADRRQENGIRRQAITQNQFGKNTACPAIEFGSRFADVDRYFKRWNLIDTPLKDFQRRIHDLRSDPVTRQADHPIRSHQRFPSVPDAEIQLRNGPANGWPLGLTQRGPGE